MHNYVASSVLAWSSMKTDLFETATSLCKVAFYTYVLPLTIIARRKHFFYQSPHLPLMPASLREFARELRYISLVVSPDTYMDFADASERASRVARTPLAGRYHAFCTHEIRQYRETPSISIDLSCGESLWSR